jgi:nitrate reductase gamma subunit
MRRAGDKKISYKPLYIATLKWLLPFGKLKSRFLFSITSVLFHIAVIIVPLLLLDHIALWRRAVGLHWPGIPNLWADVLTIVAIMMALALVIERVAARVTRALSFFQDYAIPLLIAVPFASGFLMMHPAINPFPFQWTMLVHAASADLLLVLIPITKLSHIALMPQAQVISEVAWHWPADAGSRLAAALGKENEPI